MRILVVDDDKEILELVEDFVLGDMGYTCFTAKNVSDALLHAFNVDIIITDWMLPGDSGIQLIQKVRETDPFVYIILFTARTSKEDALQGLIAGANDFIPKPFDLSNLETRLHLAEATIAINKIRKLKPV